MIKTGHQSNSEWINEATDSARGVARGGFQGFWNPPFRVMKMDFISKGKKYRNSPFETPRDEIFVFEEEQKKINLKRHHMLYRRLQYYKGA